LMLRYSYHTKTIVAQLLVPETNRKKLPWKKTDLESFINQYPDIQGVLVSHSPLGVRSAETTKDFYHIGDIEIVEKVLGKKYHYHPSQFFQIYPDAFAQILEDISDQISLIPERNKLELVDMFAGVGIIGLHLADQVAQVHGVEQSSLSKEYALKNAKVNNIDNFTFTETDVDGALKYIKPDQILVIDPPRSGLTKQSHAKILEALPQHIIYISCNTETQAADYVKLRDHYDITWSRVYNLFPKTSHVEHMIALKRK